MSRNEIGRHSCSLSLRLFASALRTLRFQSLFYRKGREERAKERKEASRVWRNFIPLQRIVRGGCRPDVAKTDPTLRVQVIKVPAGCTDTVRLFRVGVHAECRCLLLRFRNQGKSQKHSRAHEACHS